jgi:murein DD-endopeptidase MepM/ murein hydrolase activator NlpD
MIRCDLKAGGNRTEIQLKNYLLILGLVLSFALLPAAVAAEVSYNGPLIQGGLLQGKAAPGTRIEKDGTPVRVSPSGDFLLGFGRDHAAESVLKTVSPDGKEETLVLKIDKREYDIQRIDGLPPKKVTPSEEDMKRIRKEYALVAQARKRDDERTDFLSGWIWPTHGIISGVYGSQRILNGEPRRPHFGIDIAAPTGTPVKAPADGVVTMVHPDMFFSGGTLILDHGHRLSSSFLHLSKILVKEGDEVRQGDVIAEVGATGRVTGAHLDWRINWGKERVDPSLLVPPMEAPAAKKSTD